MRPEVVLRCFALSGALALMPLSPALAGAPQVKTSVNAYLVNTGEKLVLIDAGAGTLFTRGFPRITRRHGKFQTTTPA